MDMITVEKRDFAVKAKKLRRLGLVPVSYTHLRPPVVPQGSTNFAMVSQFVEIPEDMVFTEEYSVRAARIAVYTLFDIPKKICPVTPYNLSLIHI